MPVRFRDYYELLGVPRDATQEQIQRAYRELARKWHPDVNKAKEAEQRFKEINEANEVLKDPEKRKRYDTLGADWKQGQEFTPPPGFDGRHFEFHGDADGFSDFFQSLFGGGFAQAFAEQQAQQRPRAGRRRAREPEAALFRIDVTPWEAALGAEVSLRAFGNDINLKIPPGTSSGQKLRLRGVGPEHSDLIVEIRIVMPKTLTPKERELFEQLRRESKFRPEQRGP